MFIRQEADVYRGTPWSATGKSVGNLACLPSWRSRFIMVNHVLQEVHPRETDRLQNEFTCQYLAVVDPDYPKQARDIIDQLTGELREVRDFVRTERNDHHFIQEEDQAMHPKVRADLLKWKHRCAMLVLLNIVLVMLLAWVRSQTRHDKAIIIQRLQASVNNLKATLLEKGHALRASEERNTKLTFAMMSAKHLSHNIRMSLWLKHIVQLVSATMSMKIMTNTPQSCPLQTNVILQLLVFVQSKHNTYHIHQWNPFTYLSC
ncbi:hypothetical protein Cgig2_024410 [Carnegiea gigantea]|uniref:Uncharacterized protein n=1 Tax=Carnegiea gigantea TaxID=171969 RepID=A0A9Q1KKJ2_9CARY|nr:hypothetical protein Cgig2_024410 [Carnegiea gigantea]